MSRVFRIKHQGCLLLLILIFLYLVVGACASDLFWAKEISEERELQGFEWAESEGARNVLRRATQLATIQWIPLNNVPYNSGFFKADSLVVGVPYSSTKQINKCIGFDVSFHTFMTAVHNPYSVLYTENISKAPYSGVNCACYYGTVCSAAVSYAFDLDYPWSSRDFASSPDFSEIEFRTISDLKPCDIMQRDGHVVMIYKIEEYGEGSETSVTIFEAASKTAQLKTYTCDDFLHRIEAEKMRAFRYDFLNDVDTYTPSPYVPVGSESLSHVEYNHSLCPNKGDKSLYRVDEFVVIDVFNTEYDHIVFQEDGHIKYRFGINGIVNNVGHLEPGLYKVFLQKNDNISKSVEIIVADPRVTVSIADKVHIQFECPDASPVYCVFADAIGRSKYTHVFSDDEVNQGFVDLDCLSEASYYYKVVFRTQFGTIINEPILMANL